MDNGQTIPGLDEKWTLGGARIFEWASGFVMFICAQELFFGANARHMPIMMAIWLATTFGMATLRRKFPDEERGVANYFMVLAGFCPPNIAAPSSIQPVWSGAPLKVLDEKKEYVQLGLEDAIFSKEARENRLRETDRNFSGE